MKRLLVVAMALACVVAAPFVAYIVATANPPPLPTLAVLPSDTPSPTATETHPPTATHTHTSTYTLTPSLTSSATPSATLATRVLHITAIHPDVVEYPMPSATTDWTATLVPTVEVPLPSGGMALADEDAPEVGWVRYETADPAFRYVAGRWYPFQARRASQAGYSYSPDADARVTLTFVGAGVRVRYVAYALYGVFQVRIDGQLAVEIDSYNPTPVFRVTDIFALTYGTHTIEIVNTGRKNPASTSYVVALDNVEVYRTLPPAPMPTPTPGPSLTFTPSPAPAEVRLVAGPPTIPPTVTPAPPRLLAASLVIAYDENGNRSVDPAEGVQGISARLVTIGTNQVVASAFTNEEGFVRLEALADEPLRLVVPYFGKFWNVSVGRGGEASFSLLLAPGNQPGLIP